MEAGLEEDGRSWGLEAEDVARAHLARTDTDMYVDALSQDRCRHVRRRAGEDKTQDSQRHDAGVKRDGRPGAMAIWRSGAWAWTVARGVTVGAARTSGTRRVATAWLLSKASNSHKASESGGLLGGGPGGVERGEGYGTYTVQVQAKVGNGRPCLNSQATVDSGGERGPELDIDSRPGTGE